MRAIFSAVGEFEGYDPDRRGARRTSAGFRGGLSAEIPCQLDDGTYKRQAPAPTQLNSCIPPDSGNQTRLKNLCHANFVSLAGAWPWSGALFLVVFLARVITLGNGPRRGKLTLSSMRSRVGTDISKYQLACLRSRQRFGRFMAAAVAVLISGCNRAQLPSCVTGNPAPTSAQLKQWAALPSATSLDLAIDGSGSMLGLTGSAQAISAWKGLIKGVTLAAAANGLPVQAQRVGGGESKAFNGALEAADPCFFRGCGAFNPVSSSLESLWEAPGLSKGKAPLRIAISDLEANDGDIAKLVASIRPHVDQGAVIGVLAVRLPFSGKVYNSQGAVIHIGEAKRPVYLLATGPRSQLHSLLTDVRTKAALAGVPTDTMQLTFLDEQANAPSLTAKSVVGIPTDGISAGLPIRLAGTTYSPAGALHYQFAKLYPKGEGVILSSSTSLPSGQEQPDLSLVRLEAIALPGDSSGLNGLSVKGFQMSGQELSVAIRIPAASPSKALRAFVPRGQLPEAWWLSWNRLNPSDKKAHDQSDGLLLMLTSLSKLMVAPGTTPAASLCLAFSH